MNAAWLDTMGACLRPMTVPAARAGKCGACYRRPDRETKKPVEAGRR